MEKKYDVITYSDITADLIINGDDFKTEFGQKEKLLTGYSVEMGGSCTIFACQTAKMDLKTVVVGKVGNDYFKNVIVETLQDSGVILDFLNDTDKYKTGISVALTSSGDRAIFTYSGTIDALEKDDISIELIASSRHLHIGSYFLMKKFTQSLLPVLKDVKKYGTTVSLDTNWDPDESWDSGIWDVLPYVDVFLPNENEAKAITGENDLGKAINILKKEVPILSIKMGKNGARTFADKKIISMPSIDVTKMDTIGAGDSYDGGFIYGYLTGRDLETCTKMGCICGSLNTRGVGGTKGQPRLKELLEYL
jgi:sugar/nucleoside kinase (ribokinase family)